MKTMFRGLASASWLTFAISIGGAAHADVVMDWNKVAIDSVIAEKQIPPMTTRSMAMVHAAIFDAVNAIDRRYTQYRVNVVVAPGASADAAAAAAGHAVLLKLVPDRKGVLDQAFAPLLAGDTERNGVAAGIKVGEQVAAAIVAWRATDGVGAPNTYRPRTAPGVYVPTPLPIAVDFAKSKPWLMERPDQFRPGPPPALASAT